MTLLQRDWGLAPATRPWRCWSAKWKACAVGLVAVLDRMGADHGVDLYAIMDVAEDLVIPMMDVPVRIDRDALILGYAGVYSSFLLFAKRYAKKYDLSSRDILVELGARKTVGGQEDMIEDVALDMVRLKNRES